MHRPISPCWWVSPLTHAMLFVEHLLACSLLEINNLSKCFFQSAVKNRIDSINIFFEHICYGRGRQMSGLFSRIDPFPRTHSFWFQYLHQCPNHHHWFQLPEDSYSLGRFCEWGISCKRIKPICHSVVQRYGVNGLTMRDHLFCRNVWLGSAAISYLAKRSLSGNGCLNFLHRFWAKGELVIIFEAFFIRAVKAVGVQSGLSDKHLVSAFIIPHWGFRLSKGCKTGNIGRKLYAFYEPRGPCALLRIFSPE